MAQKLLTYALSRAVLPAMRTADACLVRSLVEPQPSGRPATLRGWLSAILASPAFSGEGAEIVHDTPAPLASSTGYRVNAPVPPVRDEDCRTFEPGRFLVQSCGSGACHGPGTSQTTFAVGDAATAASLLRRAHPSKDGYCTAEGGLLDAAHPGTSLIVRKLTAGAEVCGAAMPISGGPGGIDPIGRACFVRWVEGITRGPS